MKTETPKCIHCGKEILLKCARKFCSANCRSKHFYHSFKSANGITYKMQLAKKPRKSPPRYKLGRRNKLAAGISVNSLFCQACISIGNRKYNKKYSVAKLGAKAARLAASLQRMAWVIEFGVWNPDDGDPFEFMKYSDVFSKNQDYQDAELDKEFNPFRRELPKKTFNQNRNIRGR